MTYIISTVQESKKGNPKIYSNLKPTKGSNMFLKYFIKTKVLTFLTFATHSINPMKAMIKTVERLVKSIRNPEFSNKITQIKE